MELRRRHQVSALALDRLHEDRGDLVGRDQVDEDLILDEVEALGGARSGLRPDRTAIAVRVRRVEHAGQHRAEPRRCTRLLTVSDSDPSVRPWNEPRNAMSERRFVE